MNVLDDYRAIEGPLPRHGRTVQPHRPKRDPRIGGNCHDISTTTVTRRSRRSWACIRRPAGLIQGTGGVRKVRWAMAGRGRRGGSRTNYYWTAKEKHVYLLTVYAKGAKDDLTAAERDARCKAVEAIDND